VNADLLPLELLDRGETAEVADIAGEPGWRCRMEELGLRVGSRVRVVQPGSPCLLQVNGCRLCLRGACLMQILVRPVADTASQHGGD
jgi:Fe2+ transport system protein FeoA